MGKSDLRESDAVCRSFIRRARRLVAAGHPNEAISLLKECPGTVSRDIFLAQALMQLNSHREAYDLLIRRFLSNAPVKLRGRLLKGLSEAAKNVDPGLADLMHDPSLQQISAPYEHVLRAFYFGGVLKSQSAGEKAFRALNKLGARLIRVRTVAEQDYFIEFLKVYSSYTPLLRLPAGHFSGGGCFAAFGGYGCVIDPGHHFLDNFFTAGHSIDDVDGIIVSHFHDDHFADLPALLSLVYQRHRANPMAKVDLFLDEHTFRMFEPMVQESSACRRRQELRVGPGPPLKITSEVSLKPLMTRHDVLGGHTGVGLVFRIRPKDTCLVITGDTAWHERMAKRYRSFRICNTVLVAHVSTVCRDEVEGTLTGKGGQFHNNHLGIHGLCKVIEAARPQTVILAEIGEELRDSIEALSQMISKAYRVCCKVGNRGLVHRFGL